MTSMKCSCYLKNGTYPSSAFISHFLKFILPLWNDRILYRLDCVLLIRKIRTSYFLLIKTPFKTYLKVQNGDESYSDIYYVAKCSLVFTFILSCQILNNILAKQMINRLTNNAP